MNAMSSRVRAPFDHPIDYFIAVTVPSFDEGREAIRECHQHVTGSERVVPATVGTAPYPNIFTVQHTGYGL